MRGFAAATAAVIAAGVAWVVIAAWYFRLLDDNEGVRMATAYVVTAFAIVWLGLTVKERT